MDPREDFLEKINFSESKISNHKNFIFFCGGLLDYHEPNVGSEKLYKSFRGLFSDYLKNKNPDMYKSLLFAEHIQDWAFDDTFSNLLELEDMIANFSSVVLLFLESPGAIAELGSFIYAENLRDKLLVIFNDKFSTDRSFIKLGPIRFLELFDQDEKHVFYYFWDEVTTKKEILLDGVVREEEITYIDNTSLNEQEVELYEDLVKYISDNNKKKAKFKRNNDGHIMHFICEILGLFKVLTFKDIKKFMEIAKIERSEKTIKQMIFVLQELKLIKVISVSASKLYTLESTERYMKISFKDEYVFDKDRLQTDVIAYHSNENNREHLRAIKRLATATVEVSL